MPDVFLKILNMSAAASVVVAVVLLARLLLRRAPKKWSYLLWSAVGFRLCCPVSLRAAFSVFRLAPLRPAEPAAAAVTAGQTSSITYIPSFTPPVTSTFSPVSADPSLVTPLPSGTITQEAVGSPIVPAAQSTPTLAAIFAGMWLMGMAALVIYSLCSYVKIRRLVDDAVLAEGNVYETDRIRSPFILGLFRPRIYLPAGLTGERRSYVLAHERFHLRRGDHLIRVFAFLLLVVHWFNPLVWLAFRLMSRDMEMSCDEKVLGQCEGRAKEYSSTLLSFAESHRFPAASPLCFGESGVKSRIKNALAWRRPRAWVTLAAAALCLAAVTACAFNPAGKKLSFTDVPDEVTQFAVSYYEAAKESPEKAAEYVYFLSDEHRQRYLDGQPLEDYEIAMIKRMSDDLYFASVNFPVGEGLGHNLINFIGRTEEGWKLFLNADAIPTELRNAVDLTTAVPGYDPNNLGAEPYMTPWNAEPVKVDITPLDNGFHITGRKAQGLDLTVTLPESWSGRYAYVIRDSGLEVFCQATKIEDNNAGRLFWLSFESGWYPMDYPFAGNERVLASNGLWSVILGHPSDVQWTSGTQVEYADMYGEIDRVDFDLSAMAGAVTADTWVPGTVTLYKQFADGRRSLPTICDQETSRAIAALLGSKEYQNETSTEAATPDNIWVLWNGQYYVVNTRAMRIWAPAPNLAAPLTADELTVLQTALRGGTVSYDVLIDVEELADRNALHITGRNVANLDMTVVLPESWADRYGYAAYNTGVEIFCRATRDEVGEAGRLLWLDFSPGQQPLDASYAAPLWVLAANSDYSVTLGHPSDAQATVATQQEYAAMYAEVDRVRFELSPAMRENTFNWERTVVLYWKDGNADGTEDLLGPVYCNDEAALTLRSMFTAREYTEDAAFWDSAWDNVQYFPGGIRVIIDSVSYYVYPGDGTVLSTERRAAEPLTKSEVSQLYTALGIPSP